MTTQTVTTFGGYSEDILFNALAITDTALHASVASNCQGYLHKTLIVNNTLNQAVTIGVNVSRDLVTWISLGTVSVATGAGSAVGTLAGLDEYWPYVQATAQCASAPASGSVSVFLEKIAL